MPLHPDSPLFDVAELVERLNRASRPRADGRPRWNSPKAVRWLIKKGILRRARVQDGEPRKKFMLTPTMMKRAWPEFWEDLLDAEAAQAARRPAA